MGGGDRGEGVYEEKMKRNKTEKKQNILKNKNNLIHDS